MLQLNGRPLVRGKLTECIRQTQQPFLANRFPGATRIFGGQKLLQAGRGLFHGFLQRPLQADVAGPGGETADGVDQLGRQDLSQPGHPLGLGLAAELVPVLVGTQQGVLDDVRGIQLAAQPWIEFHSGE